ncbi:MAG: hypothetical protein CJBNEKGG_04039 [Prosthecobacter sp.]|nr:hypothetical protein [Prosthecobacter sp.]
MMNHSSWKQRAIVGVTILVSAATLICAPWGNLRKSKEPSEKKAAQGIPVRSVSSPASSSAQVSDHEDEDLISEMLSLLAKKPTKVMPLFCGQKIHHVMAEDIYEDEVSGMIVVTGLRRLELDDGRWVETSTDGKLIVNPDSGQMEVTATSSSFSMPDPRQKKELSD